MLNVDSIRKQFQATVAVDGISFQVEPGDIYGFLGPNGAGKTTTIRMLMSILKPDSGSIHLDGKDIARVSRNQFGYLPEERGLYQKVKLGDALKYLAQLKGLSPAESGRVVQQWLERFELADYMQKNIRELSKGNQQKVQFIATLIHSPRLIILDEPFTGLDPINQILMKDIIKEASDRGAAILFSTHQMEQVERLCNRICLINKGKIIVEGDINEIKARHGRRNVDILFEGELDESELDTYLEDIHLEKKRLRGSLISSSKALLRWISDRVDIQSYSITPPSLEEIFIAEVQASREGGEA
ncbi:MAG: ATP-binding cassette domain-containing protein [Candidatus Neomarinimicrobiota bacterium]|nr:MAG: ATP-binding cassette domain-containing protein [Candidatus Neomarinimicrobiota bacterium]